MAKKLHIDIETYSSVDIATSGMYKYMESPDFEILIICYAFDDEPVISIDRAQWDKLPSDFLKALHDPAVEKHAHNASFERNAFKVHGYDIPAEQWHCTMVKAAYCGLPLGLDMVGKALNFDTNKAKSTAGKALIKYFSCPVKPTKINGMRTRNLPHHNPEKWQEYIDYCARDVEAEREIDTVLLPYTIPEFERRLYVLDQKINDRGIMVDVDFARNAVRFDEIFAAQAIQKVKDITGVNNPKSPAQLKQWLSIDLQKEVTTLAKGELSDLIAETGEGAAMEVLKLRQLLSKTSTKKYVSILKCVCDDERVRGLLQFYGANRTGRWAGRLVQVQNLAKNKMHDLALARRIVAGGDYDTMYLLFGDRIPQVLSELIRPAFIAGQNKTFPVADFSAIEARVIAWLADEKWRLKVFRSHGKIYEASASKMFNIPIELVTKGSKWRDLGKVAELALGYQGAVGALTVMDTGKVLTEEEKPGIVEKWRKASPAIVQLWGDVNGCAIRAVKTRKKIISIHKGLEFDYDGLNLTVRLPSGRQLFYHKPVLKPNQWGNESLRYMGMDQETKQWGYVDTYGGKLVENIVQAIARDLLAVAMIKVDGYGYDVVMHVHDEIVCEDHEHLADGNLKDICNIMGDEVHWAEGLPLGADGYLTTFYKKD